MIGKTNVFGGSAEMNFAFKAYATEAAMSVDTPAENTIGIVTTTAIGKAAIKATQPTTISGAAVAEGDVWILDGTASSAAMQVSKKNGVDVWAYPLSCKQYIGGAWISKTAKSYIGGEWVGFAVYIYYQGNAYQPITGGYGSYTWYDQNMVTVINNGTDLVVSWGNGSGIQGVCSTVNKVSVSDYQNLVFGFTLSQAVTSIYFGIRSSQTGSNVSSFISYGTPAATTAKQTITLDISAITGTYYVVIGGQTNAVMTATVSEIYFV